MSQPTLRTQRDEIREEVAYLLGYGRDADRWTATMTRDIDQAVKDGLRRFYSDYDWTFLKPVVTFTTVSGTSVYDLPQGFAYFVGDITYVGPNASTPIEIIGEDELGKLMSGSTQTGRPRYGSVSSTKATQDTVRPYNLKLWPTPNGAYQLRSVMAYTVDTLTASKTDPPGGVQHAQSILAACRAAADLNRNGTIGPWEQEYLRALEASKVIESRNRPHSYGHMTPDGGSDGITAWMQYGGSVKINGTPT